LLLVAGQIEPHHDLPVWLVRSGVCGDWAIGI
jgi:hypothetical protein